MKHDDRHHVMIYGMWGFRPNGCNKATSHCTALTRTTCQCGHCHEQPLASHLSGGSAIVVRTHPAWHPTVAAPSIRRCTNRHWNAKDLACNAMCFLLLSKLSNLKISELSMFSSLIHALENATVCVQEKWEGPALPSSCYQEVVQPHLAAHRQDCGSAKRKTIHRLP